MMEITHVDTRPASALAHRVVFRRIIRDTPDLTGLAQNPRQFFINALKPIKGHRRSSRRQMGLEALIAWVRWGDITQRALASNPDPRIRKRILRASRCTPGCVGVKARYYWRCENYLCPMCWYRHVRDRLFHLSDLLQNVALESVMRVEGITREFEAVPGRDAHRNVYQTATALRRAINPAGTLTAVRLRGHPGRWVLSVEILSTGSEKAAIKQVIKDSFSGPDDLDWEVYSVEPVDPDKQTHEYKSKYGNNKRVFTPDRRGELFLKTAANCLQYPAGVYHKKFTAHDLEELFSGTQLSRSRLTGIFAS